MQENPTEDEINRQMAKAMAFMLSEENVGRHLPPEISIFAGVTDKVRPPSVETGLARLYTFLKNVNEPGFRRFMAGFGAQTTETYGFDEPRLDATLAEVASRRRQPNLGLAFEVLLESMRRGAATMTVRGPDEMGPSTLRRSKNGKEMTITSTANGHSLKRKAWTVFSCVLDGDFTLLDPDGRIIDRSEGVGSLHEPKLVAWRSEAGPATDMPIQELIDFIVSAVDLGVGYGRALSPAVLVVSEDGWISASYLADVPGGNDSEKFARCLRTASVLDPRLICLIDIVGSGWRASPLVAYAIRGRTEVLDPGATKRAEPRITIYPYDAGHEGRNVGVEESAAISIARATAFAEQARKLVD